MSNYDFPKSDLHLHLDGAISPQTMFRLAKERSVPLPADTVEGLTPYVVCDPDCRSVNEYLTKFELPTTILQDAQALETVAFELVQRSYAQGLRVCEMRFAPQLHTRNGMSQSEAVHAVERGVREGLKDCVGMYVGVILCAMCIGPASLNREANLETARLSDTLRSDIVRGFDLAGAEGVCPLSDFAELFDYVNARGVNTTCHAGDSQDFETVRTAIERFGVRRVGHGHHIFEDKALCERAKQLGVTLEICLTSNVQCQTRGSYKTHPAKQLYDMGLLVTLNTDNPIITGMPLDAEYDFAVNELGFTRNDLIQMNINSVRACFMDYSDKERYIKALADCLS